MTTGCNPLHPPVLGRKASDDFPDEHEIAIARALAEAVGAKASSSQAVLEQAFPPGVIFEQTRFADAVDAAAAEFGDVFGSVDPLVRERLGLLVDAGGKTGPLGAGVLDRLTSRIQVEQGILGATRYYTNDYFNSQVVPELFARVDQLIDTPGLVPRIDDLVELLGQRLKSVPYWRVVANAAASRGYHYGVVKAAELTGIQKVQVTAVIDQRTSAICRQLHGMVFSVRQAVAQIERMTDPDDPEAPRRYAPWLRASEIEGLDAAALEDAGVMTPPYHALCRTVLRML